MATWRQKVLVLYLGSSALDSSVKGWSLYDGTDQEAYTTGDSFEPPYETGLDALKDGWRVIQFPQLIPPYKLFSFEINNNLTINELIQYVNQEYPLTNKLQFKCYSVFDITKLKCTWNYETYVTENNRKLLNNTDKIGAVIGSGGKTIREIIEVTGTTIDIEEDGLVKVFGNAEADTAGAIRWIKTLVGQIKPGDIFESTIKRIADFGLFVELVPGMQGLLHISNIPRDKQREMSRHYKPDDKVTVKVLDYDDSTGRTSLKIVEEE